MPTQHQRVTAFLSSAKLLSAVIAALLITGCSTSLPINYIPSATIRGSESVSAGTFSYLPADQGKVDQNELQKATGAIGTIYISQPVPDLFQAALRKELLASGFSSNPDSPIKIEGTVERFLYDWIGVVEVDFYLDVTFRVIKDGQTVLTHRASSHQKAPKTMQQDTEAVRAAISSCIDEMLLEARSKRII